MFNIKFKIQKAFVFIRSYLYLFLTFSSIHGLPLIPPPRLHISERLLWCLLVALGVYFTATLGRQTFARFEQNPTVISIERDSLAWNTSFPSVTICPNEKLSEVQLNRYIAASSARNKTALRIFLNSLANANYSSFDLVTDFEEMSPDSYLGVLLDLQYEFKPTLTVSATANAGKTGLKRVITEMGICYSFNSQLAIYSSPEYWFNDFWYMVKGSEVFYVNPLDGEVFANSGNMSTGFTLYIHGPYETVDSASKAIVSENGYFLQIYLSALTIFSSQRVRNLTPQQRKCRFHDESNLRYSPVYSYVLCRMECRINLAKELCGCIPHFYRKLDGDTICNVEGLRCIAYHSEALIQLDQKCNCLPNCNDVNYVVDEADSRLWFLGSILQWGLKDYPKMRLKREVIFGFTDFLVYVGGLAGLFLGCSVLSFIELIYFFTLRLFWYAKNREETHQI